MANVIESKFDKRGIDDIVCKKTYCGKIAGFGSSENGHFYIILEKGVLSEKNKKSYKIVFQPDEVDSLKKWLSELQFNPNKKNDHPSCIYESDISWTLINQLRNAKLGVTRWKEFSKYTLEVLKQNEWIGKSALKEIKNEMSLRGLKFKKE